MKKLILFRRKRMSLWLTVAMLVSGIAVCQDIGRGPGPVNVHFRDSSGVLVPVPAGKPVFISNLTVSDTVFGNIGAATLTPSGTSGQFGWWKRNATVPQSGTISPATATDTIKTAALRVGTGTIGTNAFTDSTYHNTVFAADTTYKAAQLLTRILYSDTTSSLLKQWIFVRDSLYRAAQELIRVKYSDTTSSVAMQWELDGKIAKSDTSAMPSLTPSGTSGQFGWWKRNATAPESGTLSPATATDTIKAATALFSGNVYIETTEPNSLLTVGALPINYNSPSRLALYAAADFNRVMSISRSATVNPYQMFFGINHASGYGEIGTVQDAVAYQGVLILQRQGGNVVIGTTSFPSAGTKTLIFGSDSTAASGMNTSTAGIYADTVAGVMELKGIDGAGNITTLTPHNFSMFEPPTEASLPWSFSSQNEYVGKEIAIDMWKLAQLVEQLTGQKLIYERKLADSLVKSWDANQTYHYQVSVDQRKAEADAYQSAITDWNEKIEGLKTEDIDWSKEPKLVQSPVYVKTKPPQWLKSRLKIPSIL